MSNKILEWVRISKGEYECQVSELLRLRIMKLSTGNGWAIYVSCQPNGPWGYHAWERLIPEMRADRAKAKAVALAKHVHPSEFRQTSETVTTKRSDNG